MHGTSHNPFVGLARLTNTATFKLEGVQPFFFKDGTYLEGRDALRLWMQKEELIDKVVAYSRDNASRVDDHITLWNWLKDEVESQHYSIENEIACCK